MKSIQSVLIVMLLSSCEQQDNKTYYPEFSDIPPKPELSYVFGIFPMHNPHRLLEIFGPMMEYLSEHIEGATFKLEASRNYASFNEKLYAKKFHFALQNPFQTINAIDKGYKAFAKMGDDHNFRGIIIVRKDSGIKKVADLKGTAVSYPAPTALAATIMPQYFIQTHGVDVMTELDNQYVGSQESSIMNVFLGQTKAAGTWPASWHNLSKERPELEEELTVIWKTEPLVNLGIVVLPEVPQNIVEQVTALITNFHNHDVGRNILEPMELSRFEAASNETYSLVRDFVKAFSEKVRPL